MTQESSTRTVRIVVTPEIFALAKSLAALEGGESTYRTVLGRAATQALQVQMDTIRKFLDGKTEDEQVPY